MDSNQAALGIGLVLAAVTVGYMFKPKQFANAVAVGDNYCADQAIREAASLRALLAFAYPLGLLALIVLAQEGA